MMLHEGMLSPRRADSGVDCADRRRGLRLPFPAELLVRWFHDMSTPLRYRVVDASDDGFRIRTSVPLLTGMTGVATKLLPEGTPVDRAVTVAWVQPVGADDDGTVAEHEAGLRLM